MNDTIAIGSCPTCGSAAQCIDGDPVTYRHLAASGSTTGTPPDQKALNRAAAAIANARIGRRGAPAIKNILDVIPQNLRQECLDDAGAALTAAFEAKP